MTQPSIFTYKMVDIFNIDELIELRNGNILFLVLSQSRHSGLAISHPVSVPKMKQEFPNLKLCISIPDIPKIQCCSGIFLLGTENKKAYLHINPQHLEWP